MSELTRIRRKSGRHTV